MDLTRLQYDTSTTNDVEHVTVLHNHVMLQFSYDQNITDIQRQKVKAQQTMMMRNYLKKYADKYLLRELHDVLKTFPQTRSYLDLCILGVIRASQKKIYSLHAVFDTDDFRLEHMCVKHDRGGTEDYYERASEVNNWRSMIDVETRKIVDFAQESIAVMKDRFEGLPKEKFMMHPDYVGFYGKAIGVIPFGLGAKRARTD